MLKLSYFSVFFLFCNLFSFITLLSGDSSNEQDFSTQPSDLMVTSSQTRNINNSGNSAFRKLMQPIKEKTDQELSMPVNSMNSDSQKQANEDGLYDNGILGFGFSEESLETQRLAKILEATRNYNHQAEFQQGLAEAKKFKELYSSLTSNSNQINQLSSECHDQLVGYVDVVLKLRDFEKDKCYPSTISLNPVVLKVFSDEKSGKCPFSVCVSLHQLEQKLANRTLNEKVRGSNVLRRYLEKYERGIDVVFTDLRIVHLFYDKDSKRIKHDLY